MKMRTSDKTVMEEESPDPVRNNREMLWHKEDYEFPATLPDIKPATYHWETLTLGEFAIDCPSAQAAIDIAYAILRNTDETAQYDFLLQKNKITKGRYFLKIKQVMTSVTSVTSKGDPNGL